MRNQKLAFSNAETGKDYGYKKEETVIYHCTQIEENGVLILIWDKNKNQWLWANIEYFKPKKEGK